LSCNFVQTKAKLAGLKNHSPNKTLKHQNKTFTKSQLCLEDVSDTMEML